MYKIFLKCSSRQFSYHMSGLNMLVVLGCVLGCLLGGRVMFCSEKSTLDLYNKEKLEYIKEENKENVKCIKDCHNLELKYLKVSIYGGVKCDILFFQSSLLQNKRLLNCRGMLKQYLCDVHNEKRSTGTLLFSTMCNSFSEFHQQL